ncbi:DUF421 domain-containing protein [Paenibacillus rigui]|uniref:YetF C-terminal domain-containing protein n=1 Tax=Paenibacillus rigui TaxID=554312 RepID=A0A229UG52_9BACL|nr:YetF domain-containing protein [Paenibacillus rigui]OXM82364.1 hypothetical protein CF651_31515 [Paenibacillus rigui]
MGNIILNAIILAAMGTLLLRLAGRKSLAQMTTPQVAILLTIGAVLGSEVGGKGLLPSIIATATFIGFLVAMEWISLRWNGAETAVKGKAILIISDGNLMIDNLKKLRMSVDDLEQRLRLAGISHFQDVKTGTIERNGEFGYEWMPEAKPVTVKDLERILGEKLGALTNKNNIFTEIKGDTHEQAIPEILQ